MKRRLIKQGGGGYTIYLPKKWADAKGLKEGSDVHIKERDTALIIQSAIREKSEITLAITDHNRKDLYPILTHLYRSGVDKLTLNKVSITEIKLIKQYTERLLLGFEVTDVKDDTLILENISEPTEERYEALFRRVFLIIKETHSIIEEDFQRGIFDKLAEIETLRDQQDKFILFCKRTLMKERKESNPSIEWELLTWLMHINHSYHYFYKYAAKNKTGKNKNVLEFLPEIKEYFDHLYNAYYKKDAKEVHIMNSKKELYHFGECYTAIEKAKGKDAVLLCHVRELFRIIQLASSPILTTLLQQETGKE